MFNDTAECDLIFHSTDMVIVGARFRAELIRIVLGIHLRAKRLVPAREEFINCVI